jgi:hypothetical protein
VTSEEIERKLRTVEYCNIPLRTGCGTLRADFNLALKAARMIKRQRKEIEALTAELAYHGVYAK